MGLALTKMIIRRQPLLVAIYTYDTNNTKIYNKIKTVLSGELVGTMLNAHYDDEDEEIKIILATLEQLEDIHKERKQVIEMILKEEGINYRFVEWGGMTVREVENL